MGGLAQRPKWAGWLTEEWAGGAARLPAKKLTESVGGARDQGEATRIQSAILSKRKETLLVCPPSSSTNGAGRFGLAKNKALVSGN